MRLAGFVVLLVVIVFAARAAGARFGPVTTTHSHVLYTGGPASSTSASSTSTSSTTPGTGGTTMNGMNMSGRP
jgi:hypothetical protein